MIGVSDKEGGLKSVTMIDCSKGQQKIIKEDKADEHCPDANVDVMTVTESMSENPDPIDSTLITTTTTTKVEITSSSTFSTAAETPTTTTTQVKRSLETTDQDNNNQNDEDKPENSSKRVKLEANSACKLEIQPKDAYPDQEVNLFATEGWRDLLCQCPACLALYTKENVTFIIGEEAIYEDEDNEDVESSILESGMKKLNEMDRVQMMDGMLAYSKMRDEIRSFLAPFSEQGKVVTEDDVRAFFTVSAV